jgi:PAS domain S-box-containing protein
MAAVQGGRTEFAAGGEMSRRVAAHDWAATPLGAIGGWSSQLRTAVEIMLDSRHPMLIWWGDEHTVLYNDAFMELAGSKHPRGLGRPGWEMFDDVWPVIGPMLRGVLDAGTATWVDDQLLLMNRRGRDEETYWTYSFSPIRDAEGRAAGIFTATTDTTARVLGERRLRALRDLGEVSSVTARSVEEACRAAVSVLARYPADVPAAAVYLVAPDATSATRVAAHGFPPGSEAPERVRADQDHPLWKVVGSGVEVHLDEPSATLGSTLVLPVLAVGRDRPDVVLHLRLSPTRTLDGEDRSFCDLIARQLAAAVSDAAAYEAERVRAESLAALDRAKNEFFAGVSHELRTPLALIMGPVEELRSTPDPDPERLRTELEVMHRNGRRLSRLVDTLLDFSRLQAGKIHAGYQPVDLAAATADLAGVFRSAVERAGLELVVDCEPLGEPVWVDRDMWEKVVSNLLSNALKHTFDGSITVSVMICGDEVVLRVADTGVGVPADQVSLLFDRFHRVPGARARSVEGTGIGLTLVRELVELHGGRVAVESEVDTGSVFTVSLRRGNAHVPDDLPGAGPEPAVLPGTARSVVGDALRWLDTAPTPVPGAGAVGSSARVLVVDDNADMREYLVRLLAPSYEVLAVGDGDSALVMATAQQPDLVLTDVMMPGLDGFALVAALRADPRTADLPVVMLSARAGEEAAVDGLRAGADDYLVKPFAAAELLSRVGSQVALSRLRRREGTWLRTLIGALPDGVFVLDDQHRVVEANDAFTQVLGWPAAELPYPAPHPWWPEPGTDPDARRTVEELFTGDTLSHAVVPCVHRDGHRVWVAVTRSSALDPHTGRQVTVGTVRDVTAERAAHTASDAAAARMRAMVNGLNAVFWEADAQTFRYTFVSDRAEELLGYPVEQWMTTRGFWPSIMHRDDRAATIRFGTAETRAGRDHDLSYRAITANGEVVWVHDLVHVVTDDRGHPVRLQGIMIDVTPQRRAEVASAVLADASRVLAEVGPLPVRLATLARQLVGRLADSVIVSMMEDDGRLTHIATAHADPDLEPLLARAAHANPPAALVQAFERGVPFVVPTLTDELRTADDPADETMAARRALGSRTALVVPLTLRGQVLGSLTLASADPVRRYDASDLTLAGELGRRVTAAVEAHQLRERGRRLQLVTRDLAAAATTAEAAAALVEGARIGLDATRSGVYRITPDGRLTLVHMHGYPTGVEPGDFASLDIDDPLPLTDSVRAGTPLWIENLDEFRTRYAHLADTVAVTGTQATAVLPMRVAGAVTGALTLSYDRPKIFFPDDRDYAALLTGLAAQAFERTIVADERRRIADTLQRSLLPAEPPDLARLAIAQRYLPGAEGAQAGGDWYDVLVLDDDRVAIAVGDVVGQGAAAAAVMGQLRSALSAHLLDGDAPAVALSKLDRFSHRVAGSRASTAACLLLDTRSGHMRWARAGHLPPLHLCPDGAHYLDGATGCVLGIPGAPPFTEADAVLEPGSTVLLYTDGLVERRGEVIDDGLDRLAAAAAAHPHADPDTLIAALFDATLDDSEIPDDIAVIAVRLRPPPMLRTMPARAQEARALRPEIVSWAAAGALPDEIVVDLQLAVGEAVTNAVDHAYPGTAPGPVAVSISHLASGDVQVEVTDRGRWRPPPEDAGLRGHGLPVIRALAQDVELDPSDTGTRIRFRIPLHPER